MTEITERLKGTKPEKLGSKIKFFNLVAKCNQKVHEGKEDLVILKDWIRKMEKIFDVVEVPDNKRKLCGLLSLRNSRHMVRNR